MATPPASDQRRAASGCDDGVLEVLVRRAVVPSRQRRPLAGLALACRRVAARDPAIQEPGLDLLLDEARRRADPFTDGPGDLRLCRDREVASDVSEKRPVGPSEVLGVLGE